MDFNQPQKEIAGSSTGEVLEVNHIKMAAMAIEEKFGVVAAEAKSQQMFRDLLTAQLCLSVSKISRGPYEKVFIDFTSDWPKSRWLPQLMNFTQHKMCHQLSQFCRIL